ncbi:hypothetical protein NQ315_005987 [Exocentrus adspersus]|uniref:Uncharacterized protein n=1 Tax=Exocentrus adspersus TaxID=1586481 RepID=A0AAV8VBT9_9CUCU|nr:hypothetical protein NQ315_005987 [Exocentrus adspersus]
MLKNAVKACQEEMKKDQEEMKTSQEEMKTGQKKLKQDMKKGQAELKEDNEDMKKSQEKIKEDMEASQEKLELKIQEMKTTIEEINQVKGEEKFSHMKEDAKVDKKELNKKMEDLETKFRQLSTTGLIKAGGTVTTPSNVKYVRNWKEEDKTISLITALRGEALEVLRTISEARPNYAMLTNALERRYGYARLQHVYQTQLRSRRQRFEETLQQYVADISRMVNLAYPTAPTEVIKQLSVSSFVNEFRDPEIGELVRLATDTRQSLKIVCEAHTLEIEAVKEASRVETNPYQD